MPVFSLSDSERFQPKSAAIKPRPFAWEQPQVPAYAAGTGLYSDPYIDPYSDPYSDPYAQGGALINSPATNTSQPTWDEAAQAWHDPQSGLYWDEASQSWGPPPYQEPPSMAPRPTSFLDTNPMDQPDRYGASGADYLNRLRTAFTDAEDLVARGGLPPGSEGYAAERPGGTWNEDSPWARNNVLDSPLSALDAPRKYIGAPALGVLTGAGGMERAPVYDDQGNVIGYKREGGQGLGDWLGNVAETVRHPGGAGQAFEEYSASLPWAGQVAASTVSNPLNYIGAGLAGKLVPGTGKLSGFVRGALDQGGGRAVFGAAYGSAGAAELAPDEWKTEAALLGGVIGGIGGVLAPRALSTALKGTGKGITALDRAVMERAPFDSSEFPAYGVIDPETGRPFSQLAPAGGAFPDEEMDAFAREQMNQLGRGEKVVENLLETTGLGQKLTDTQRQGLYIAEGRILAGTAKPEEIALFEKFLTEAKDVVPPEKLPVSRFAGEPAHETAARQAVLGMVDEEAALRGNRVPESEIRQGRARQAEAYRTGFDKAIADGLSPQDASVEARKGMAGPVRQTAPESMAALPFDDLYTMVGDAWQRGTINDFEHVRLMKTLMEAADGKTPQPAQMALLRKLFGEDIVNEVTGVAGSPGTPKSWDSPNPAPTRPLFEDANEALIEATKFADDATSHPWTPDELPVLRQNIINQWHNGNRALLDGLGRDAEGVTAKVGAMLVGDTPDSYVTQLLHRKAFLRTALEDIGFSPDDAYSLAESAGRAELRKHFPHEVPKSTQAALAKIDETPDTMVNAMAHYSQEFKNLQLGIGDFAVAGQQGLKALVTGGPQIFTGAVNRLLTNAHMPHVDTDLATSLVSRRSQAILDGVAHRAATGMTDITEDTTLLRHLPFVGKAIDNQAAKLIKTLTDLQFNKVLGTLRDLNYEGNLAIAKLTGADIQNPVIRRQLAEWANANTSAWYAATNPNRREFERAMLLSPQMRRAQVAQLNLLGDLIRSPKDRVAQVQGITTLLSTVAATLAAGKLLNDTFGVGDIEYDPTKSGFGVVTIGGRQIDLFPQLQVVKALLKSARVAAEGNPEDMLAIAGQLGLSSASPLNISLLKAAGVGYDPTHGYQWGDYGAGMSTKDRFLSSLPIPPVFQSLALGKGDMAGTPLDLIGLSNYPESGWSERDRRLVGDPDFGAPYSELSHEKQLLAVQKYGTPAPTTEIGIKRKLVADQATEKAEKNERSFLANNKTVGEYNEARKQIAYEARGASAILSDGSSSHETADKAWNSYIKAFDGLDALQADEDPTVYGAVLEERLRQWEKANPEEAKYVEKIGLIGKGDAEKARRTAMNQLADDGYFDRDKMPRYRNLKTQTREEKLEEYEAMVNEDRHSNPAAKADALWSSSADRLLVQNMGLPKEVAQDVVAVHMAKQAHNNGLAGNQLGAGRNYLNLDGYHVYTLHHQDLLVWFRQDARWSNILETKPDK